MNQSTARDEILARLQAAAQPTPLPPQWATAPCPVGELVEPFVQALTAAKGEVRRVADLAAAFAALEDLLLELGVTTAVVNDDLPWSGPELAARLTAVSWTRPGPDRAAWRDACATADLGLSGAVAALAETGSIVVHSGVENGRLTSLLPPVHLVLLAASQITANLFTWSQARRAPLPANVILISGPSKTADIEQTLAIGVHGPKRLLVILYDEA